MEFFCVRPLLILLVFTILSCANAFGQKLHLRDKMDNNACKVKNTSMWLSHNWLLIVIFLNQIMPWGFSWGLDWIRGVITPNIIPLMTIVTYLQKSYRSRISNHWATISAYSVVGTSHLQTVQENILSDSHKMSVAILTPTPDIHNLEWLYQRAVTKTQLRWMIY